jgi:hypothetical protein
MRRVLIVLSLLTAAQEVELAKRIIEIGLPAVAPEEAVWTFSGGVRVSSMTAAPG